MLVVNVAGYDFSFKDKRTGKLIVIPNDGKSYLIPDYSPINFRELRYLNVTPIKNGKKLSIDVDLSTLSNKNEVYNVKELQEEFKEEIRMLQDEKTEEVQIKIPTKKKSSRKTTTAKKKPLSGKKINPKKRKELLEKYTKE